MLHITIYMILLILQEELMVVRTQYNQPEYFNHDPEKNPEFNVGYYMPEVDTMPPTISTWVTTPTKRRPKRRKTFTSTEATKFFVILNENSSDILTKSTTKYIYTTTKTSTTLLPTLPSSWTAVRSPNKMDLEDVDFVFNTQKSSPKYAWTSQSSSALTIPTTVSTSATTTRVATTTLSNTTTLNTTTVTNVTDDMTPGVSIPLRSNTNTTINTTLATTTIVKNNASSKQLYLPTRKPSKKTTTIFIPTKIHTTTRFEPDYADSVEVTSPTTPVYEEVIEYEELMTDPFTKSFENMLKIFATMNETHVVKFIRIFEKHLLKKIAAGSFHPYGPVINTFVENSVSMLEAPVDEMQRIFAMGYHEMRSRRKSLAADLNSMLDYVDMLYSASEEQKFQDMLNDTATYPNVSKTLNQLVDSLIMDVFIMPMRRVSGTSKGNILFASMTKVIQVRHPEYSRRFHENKNEHDDIMNRQVQSIKEGAKGYRKSDRRLKFAKEGDNIKHSSEYYTRRYRIKVTDSKKRFKHSRSNKKKNDVSDFDNNKINRFKIFDDKDIKHKYTFSHKERRPDTYLSDFYSVATTVKRKRETLKTFDNKNDRKNKIEIVKRANVMSDTDSNKVNEENETLSVSDKDDGREMRVKLDNILGGNVYYNKINLDRNRKRRYKELGRDRRVRPKPLFHVKMSSTIKPVKQPDFDSERKKSFRDNNYNTEYTQYSTLPSSNTNSFLEQTMENSPKAVSTTIRFHNYKSKAVNNSITSQFSMQKLPDTTPFKFFRLNPDTHQNKNDEMKYENKLVSIVSEFGQIPNIIDFSMKVQLKNPMKGQGQKDVESYLVEKENNANLRDRQTTYEPRTLNPYKMDKYFVTKVTRDPGVWYISEKSPPNNVNDAEPIYDIYAGVSVEAGQDQDIHNNMPKDKKQSHNRKHDKEHLRKRHKRKRDKHRKRRKHGKHSIRKHKSKHHRTYLKKKKHERKRHLHHNLRTHNNKQIIDKSFEISFGINEEKKKRYNVVTTPKDTHMKPHAMVNNANNLNNRARTINSPETDKDTNMVTNDKESVFRDSAYNSEEYAKKNNEHIVLSEPSSSDEENKHVEPKSKNEKDYVTSELVTSEYHVQNERENFSKNMSSAKKYPGEIKQKETENQGRSEQVANFFRNTGSADDMSVNRGQKKGIQNPKHKNIKNVSKEIPNNKITHYKTNLNKDFVSDDRDSVTPFKKEKSKKNIDDLASATNERENKHNDNNYKEKSNNRNKHNSNENTPGRVQKNSPHKTKVIKDVSNSDEVNLVTGYKAKKDNLQDADIDSANREYINKDKETKYSNEDLRRRGHNKNGKVTKVNLMQDSVYSDDEEELKKNLYDAFRHDDRRDYRKHMRHDLQPKTGLQEEPVYTDDEAVLKRRIYEVINGKNNRKFGQFG